MTSIHHHRVVSLAVAIAATSFGCVGWTDRTWQTQPPRQTLGHAEIHLDAPWPLDWSGRAECLTVADSDGIASVSVHRYDDAQPVWITLYLDRSVADHIPRLSIGQPRDLRHDPPDTVKNYGWEDTVELTETGSDRTSGRVVFEGLLPQPDMPDIVADPGAARGVFRWDCAAPLDQGGPDPHDFGDLSGAFHARSVDGTFMVDVPIDGICDNATFGLSYWNAAATASKGEGVIVEVQVDRDLAVFAIHLDADSKDSRVFVRLDPTELGTEMPWSTTGRIEETRYGPIDVEAEWSCTP